MPSVAAGPLPNPYLNLSDSPLETAGTAENKRFNRGVIFSLLRYGILIVTGFGYSMLSAHLLGAEIVGTVALLTSILGLFRPISSLGEQLALVPTLNRYGPNNSQASALFWVTVGISALTTLILSLPYGLLTSNILSHVYHRPDLMGTLFIYMIGFYSIYNVSLLVSAPFQAYQEMKYYAFTELLSGLAKMLILVALIFTLGATPLAAVAAQVGGFAVSAIILLVFLPKVFKMTMKHFSRKILKTDLKEVYRYSFKSLPSFASISVLQHADRLIIGYFCSTSLLGVYTFAYSLFERVLMMGTNYENMIFSSASRLTVTEEYETLKGIYRSALRTSFFWLTPIVVVIIGFADYIMSLFGKEFVLGEAALIILLVGVLFDNFGRITTGVVGGLNLPGSKTGIVVAGAATNLILNLVLIPKWGIEGAALANSIGYVVTAVLCIAWLLCYCRIKLLDAQFILELGILFVVNCLLLLGVSLFRDFSGLGCIGAGIYAALFLALYHYLGKRWAMRPESGNVKVFS